MFVLKEIYSSTEYLQSTQLYVRNCVKHWRYNGEQYGHSLGVWSTGLTQGSQVSSTHDPFCSLYIHAEFKVRCLA